MTPLGHAAISFITASVLVNTLPSTNPNIILSGVIIGGTILDLDVVYHLYKKGKSALGRNIGKHRFLPTHTPLFSLTLSLVISAFNKYLAIFFFLGTLIHFLGDMFFFPEGVNLFYPLTKKTKAFIILKKKSFWVPKKIYSSDNWWKNYLISPLFLVFEGIPIIISFMLLLAR